MLAIKCTASADLSHRQNNKNNDREKSCLPYSQIKWLTHRIGTVCPLLGITTESLVDRLLRELP